MKTKLLFIAMFCLALLFGVNGQTVVCQVPPNCIQNGDLLGPTGSGNMNSTAALTVPSWHVSHGTPTYGPSSVWMWSHSSVGEGVFTCYQFVAGRTYNVCFRANYAGTNATGVFNVFAANGLLSTYVAFPAGGPPPTPTSSQLIANPNITNPAWNLYSFVFTASANFSELWFYPFLTATQAGQYAINLDNIHVEDLSTPAPAISITPSGPLVNGVPVNLTASGAPAGATYNWSPSGFTGNPLTATPNCDDQIISVTASYNNCPTPGTVICERTSAPATINIKATEGCCATITTSVYCNGSHAMMSFWITNTSTFNFNAYRLYNCISGTVQDWNNAISIPIGMTGGPYTIDLTALGYSPYTSTCFCLDMIEYVPEELCPKNVCRTDRFCIDIPKCDPKDCCGEWGVKAYDDYSNPHAPVGVLFNCGDHIKLPCNTNNGFHYNYNCREGCSPTFKSELYDPGNNLVYSNTASGSPWYNIYGLPLTSNGVFRLVVYVYCGQELCDKCELYIDVSCLIHGEANASGAIQLHSIIPNPSTSMTTITSRAEPIVSYAVQSQSGAVLMSGNNINKKEITIDVHSLTNGFYTLIINNKYTYKLVKQE